MNEFFNYHAVPATLQKRIRNYIEFQFSVTKGIDVEGFNQDLPSHLQLELFLHLNRRMVEQVRPPPLNGLLAHQWHHDRGPACPLSPSPSLFSRPLTLAW